MRYRWFDDVEQADNLVGHLANNIDRGNVEQGAMDAPPCDRGDSIKPTAVLDS